MGIERSATDPSDIVAEDFAGNEVPCREIEGNLTFEHDWRPAIIPLNIRRYSVYHVQYIIPETAFPGEDGRYPWPPTESLLGQNVIDHWAQKGEFHSKRWKYRTESSIKEIKFDVPHNLVFRFNKQVPVREEGFPYDVRPVDLSRLLKTNRKVKLVYRQMRGRAEEPSYVS